MKPRRTTWPVRLWRALACGGSYLIANTASAATLCSLATQGVAFGSYDIVSPGPTDSTGTIELVCIYEPTPGGPRPLVSVYFGAGASGVFADRRMQSATDTLHYNLYTDAARTQIWGDGTSGTVYQTTEIRAGPGVGNASRTVLISIYGRIPALQSVDSGDYSDTIVVTVEF